MTLQKFLQYFLQHWVDMKCLEFHVATSTKLKFWFCKQSVARHLLNFLLKFFLHCHNTKDEFKHMRKKKLSYLFQVFICPFGKSFLLNGISLIWNKKENTRIETWNIFINVHKGVETGSQIYQNSFLVILISFEWFKHISRSYNYLMHINCYYCL